MNYEILIEFCETKRQKIAVEAMTKYKNLTEAGSAINMDLSNMSKMLRKIERRAAKKGVSLNPDFHKPTQEGYSIKGTSTLYDGYGKVRSQWVKTDKDKEALELAAQAAIEAFKSEVPRVEATTKPFDNLLNSKLLNQYTITDFHLGMMAWGEETGDDWDTSIAEQLLVKWFAKAVELAPDAETAIFCQLGDFLHWDGLEAVTVASHNVLDADTRFQKLVRVAIRVFRKIITMLLEKHSKVHVIMAEGNHDPASSIWLRELFSAHYENEPRVSVENSPTPYYCYQHGDTALFYHHGHKRGVANVDTVFAGMFREIFGKTKFAFAHLGHKHSVHVKETNLMVVEQHRTLSAPDAYAARGGWISGRDAKVITYHKDHGEVSRVVINPDMVG